MKKLLSLVLVVAYGNSTVCSGVRLKKNAGETGT
jgi:hypothetical protein